MKAQKKPVVIDYYEITDMETAWNELPVWVQSFGDKYLDHFVIPEPVVRKEDIEIAVKIMEGVSYYISTADVVIRGVKGKYYPCEKEVFALTYDKL